LAKKKEELSIRSDAAEYLTMLPLSTSGKALVRLHVTLSITTFNVYCRRL